MDEKRLRCGCGWEVTGTEDEVVAATMEHAEKLHNMRATREECVSRMEEAAES
jgi:predicted small metal-binding protein